MEADYSVELTADDDVLDFPWASDDGTLRYYDLRQHPDLLLYVSEAAEYTELGRYLAAVNSGPSAFLTAKCDVWLDEELSEAEDIFEASCKLACYVDHLFAGPLDGVTDARFSFERHERVAQRIVELLSRVPPISAALEIIIRRCYYREIDNGAAGYYMTLYTFGYGEDAIDARQRWGIALNLLQNVLLQVSAEVRRNEL